MGLVRVGADCSFEVEVEEGFSAEMAAVQKVLLIRFDDE